MTVLKKRTNFCGLLGKGDTGSKVTLMGWVHRRRDLGGLIFVDMRDRSGIVQIVFNPEAIDTFKLAEQLRNEFVIAISGTVMARPEEVINRNLETGEIEVSVEALEILNKSETPPFILDNGSKVDEGIRLKYRYLDLRRPSMLCNLQLRHKVSKAFRDFLDSKGFIDVETPFLTKSTPEGARDYLVPSRVNPGKFYALPQSPQLFKQLLMVGGLERYYQIVRCFRDEDLRKDRQPEFTQVDIEMSFVDREDVMALNEEMVAYIYKKVLNIALNTPFQRLSYGDAMNLYGSDKPDTRFDMLLTDVSLIVKYSSFKVFNATVKSGGVVKGIKLSAPLSRRDIDGIEEKAKAFGAKGLAWIQVTGEGIKSPISKFLTEEELNGIISTFGGAEGDIIFIMADTRKATNEVLGYLRLYLGEKYQLIDEAKYNFLWVTDFPLLEFDEEENRFVACHHPFTAPIDNHIELLEENPRETKAKAYDLVLNGIEIAGGSIRIYRADVQEKMFKALGFSKEEAYEKFGFLLDAFKYGTPPHGGIAYGLDRLVMLMAGRESIREVIAFPKTQQASDPMTQAPSVVSTKQLKELHISVNSLKETGK
jgi:aspartyl-tRNA synthetase